MPTEIQVGRIVAEITLGTVFQVAEIDDDLAYSQQRLRSRQEAL